MNIYFVKALDYNCVVLSDGCTAKIYYGNSDGIYEGIDLYSDDALEQYMVYFKKMKDEEMLEDYDMIYADDINIIQYDDFVELLDDENVDVSIIL